MPRWRLAGDVYQLATATGEAAPLSPTWPLDRPRRGQPAGAVVSLPPRLSQPTAYRGQKTGKQGTQGWAGPLAEMDALAVYHPGSHLDAASLRQPFFWPGSQGLTVRLQVAFALFPQGGRGVGAWERAHVPIHQKNDFE